VHSPLDAIVVMRMPTVALINGEGSPTAFRQLDLIKLETSPGNIAK